MSSAIKKAIEKLFGDAQKSKGAITRLTKPSTEGAGGRVYPARNQKNDAKYGIRIDKGEEVHGQPNVVRLELQANSNADSKTIKDLARKDPHAVLATVDVDTTQEATEENLAKVKEDLLSNLKI
ncbi:hypothetical protein B0O99DRAFT_332067 [Bisporella sp. PMI_857]|nr:hypothetical protein B0O99DRAFT_332067 [Bisporella sp. PMI_857]